MAAQLTRGAVDAMHKGQQIRTPLVQVIDVKKILGPSGQATTPERYRLVISDGEHFQQAMLATQLNDLVNDGRLQPKCVVRLNEYICNTVHGRRIVIVLSVELTGPPLSHTIGTPQNIEEASAAPTSAPAPAMTSAPARPAPQQQQHHQTSRPFQSNTSSSRASSSAPALPEGVIPIKGLNPYQNRWTIKARVTAKSDKRNFNSSRGTPGTLFSVDLLDAYGGEIRCTFFGEAAEQWSDVMAVGDVYLIGRGTVKYANKKFSNLKNDYEISIDQNGLVEQQDDDSSIPFFRFSFVDIADLPQHNKDETIDIIGAVMSVGDVATINTKAGNALQKRVIYVGDSSNAQVEITLWGDQADNWTAVPGSVLLFKGVKVSDFNNRSLSVLRTSKVESEPRIPEADRVRQWYATYGHGVIHSVSQNDFRRGGGGGGDGGFGGGAGGARWDDTRKTFADVKHETQSGNNTYFTLRATITEIKHSRDHPPWYEACPTEKCNKKVTPVNGAYHCSKCDATHDHYIPRYILSINANDHTGSSWLTCFNDSAPAVLNQTAEQLHQWLSQQGGAGIAQYESVFEEALFKTYSLRVRASEGYESKVKLNVVKATPLDYAKESKILIDGISKYISV